MSRVPVATFLLAALLAACGGKPAERRQAGPARLACPPCLLDLVCVDDPGDGCDPAVADCPGICVTPVFCGGIAAVPCPAGQTCVDDPRDDCAPPSGADCSGLCAPAG